MLDFKAILSDIDAVILKLNTPIGEGLTIASLFAPQYAPEIKLAEFFNGIIGKVAADHVAAGCSPESLNVAAGTIIQAIATIPGVSPESIQQAQDIAAVLAPATVGTIPIHG